MAKDKRWKRIYLNATPLTVKNKRMLRFAYKRMRRPPADAIFNESMSKKKARKEIQWVLDIWLRSIAAEREDET